MRRRLHDRHPRHPRRVGYEGRPTPHPQRAAGALCGRDLPRSRTSHHGRRRSARSRRADRRRLPHAARVVIALSLYSRPGCHLCNETKAVIARVARAVPLTLHEIEISRDRELEVRYGLEIPVLEIEGRKAAKYRITEEELTRLLKAGRGG